MTTLLPYGFIATVIVVLGLIIGSFLNVVIARVPDHRSLSTPSACPNCSAPIRWWQNIPVFSWLALRGKCAKCGQPISAQYPLVELFTALAFFGVLFWLGNPLSLEPALTETPISFETVATGWFVYSTKLVVLVAFLYVVSVSIALSVIDLRTKKLPNVIVLPSVVVAFVFIITAALLTGDPSGLIRAALGALIYAGIYFVIIFIYPAGMGMGDLKLALVLGAYLGWHSWSALIIGWLAPFILGGLWVVFILIFRGGNRKTEIPFGPWMIIGCWIGLIVGTQLVNGYLGLLGVSAL